MTVKISSTIITFNEEENIGRCIDSLAGIVDEIVVVDSFSTDGTEAVCHARGVKFIQHAFEGHVQQKNFAIQQATHDHILSLDADEALSTEAREKIKQIRDHLTGDGYRFNRITNYCGTWIRHCGWYPDKKVRLFDRRKAAWGGENPHDKIILEKDAHVVDLNVDILHFSLPTIHSHALTANQFSEIAAQEAIKKGKKIYFVSHILLNPFFTFIKKYFFQLGFLDGFYGFVICILSAHSNFLKYTKIWSYHKMHKN